MKNYFKIAKKAYHTILMIPEMLKKLEETENRISELIERNFDELNQKNVEIAARSEALLQKSVENQEKLKSLHELFQWKIDERSNAILAETALMQKQAETRFWSLYRNESETDFDSRKRFFSSLPKATGGLRLLQMGNAILLKKLSEICRENNFPYWLQSGTLLGAVRHKGFVPWDDDTDCAMFRDDIEKLRELLRNNPKYQVTLVYDWWAKSRQIRFRPRDLSIPCFVDIYIYDRCGDGSDEYWERQKTLRAELIRAIEENPAPEIQFWREHPLLDESSEQASFLENLFETLRARAAEKSIPVEHGEKAVSWALDNFSVGWKRLFDWDFLFPCATLEYEGESYDAPKEYVAYVKRQYGNIWELPHDMVSHFHHVPHDELEREEMQEKLKSFLNPSVYLETQSV